MKLKISLDFDSVLADTMITWTEKYNQKKGTTLTKSDIISWEFWKDLKIESEYVSVCFRESWEDWKNLPPTEENLDQKITKLSEYGTIDIVTKVDETHLQYVGNWLEHNGISDINSIKHAGNEKITLPYDLFIDDSPSLAIQAENNNKRCFVYHQQWNKHVPDNTKLSRIRNLTDALEKISDKTQS